MYIDNSILIPAEKKDAQKPSDKPHEHVRRKVDLISHVFKVDGYNRSPTCFFGSLVLGVNEDYTTILMIMIIMFAIYKLCSLIRNAQKRHLRQLK